MNGDLEGMQTGEPSRGSYKSLVSDLNIPHLPKFVVPIDTALHNTPRWMNLFPLRLPSHNEITQRVTMKPRTSSPPPLVRRSHASKTPFAPPTLQRVGRMPAYNTSFIPTKPGGDSMLGDETDSDGEKDEATIEDDPVPGSFFTNSLQSFNRAVEHAGHQQNKLHTSSNAGSSIIVDTGHGFQPRQRPSPPAVSSSLAKDSVEAYKYQICSVLKINYDKFSDVSLDNLRAYARVFNGYVRGNRWEPPAGMIDATHGDVYVKIRTVMQRNPVGDRYLGYFAGFSLDWLRIADARGDPKSLDDIDPDDESTKGTYFSPKCEEHEDTEEVKKALGITDNPFGKFPGYG